MKNYVGPSLGGSYAGKNLRNKSSAKYYGSLLKGFSVGGKVTKRKKNKSANISKNFEKQFKYRQDRMLENVLRSRIFDFSYTINMSEDFVDLYNCFLETVKSIFKTCNLIPKNPSCYACVLDNRFSHTLWHTHVATSHISAAFYLKQPSEIGFQAESGEFTIKPKEFDMLIFSSQDYHKPMAPKNKDLRVSLNIETYCKEGINVFNKSNIKEI